DVVVAVMQLNKTGKYNLGIIFRRCPVDLSDRYNKVLRKYQDVITPIAPLWKQAGNNWNAILPTKDDLKLQVNTILHTKAVINLASSMVFDYAVFDKPCLYLNYEVENKEDPSWTPQKVYDFVHFRSMPNGDEDIWLNFKEVIASKLEVALKSATEKVAGAKKWFEKINQIPAQDASHRIWKAIEKIHSQCT